MPLLKRNTGTALMMESLATNASERTVFKKPPVSLMLLEQGMRRLHEDMSAVNKGYLDEVELNVLQQDFHCIGS